VTRKVLVTWKDSAALQAPREGQPERRDRLGICTKGASSDHRILSIRRQIEHGREIKGAACPAQIEGNLLAGATRELEIAGGTERHHRWHGLHTVLQAHDSATLLVDCDYGRKVFVDAGRCAKLVGERADLFKRRVFRREQYVAAKSGRTRHDNAACQRTDTVHLCHPSTPLRMTPFLSFDSARCARFAQDDN
jgi:hypothetical protein